MIPNIQKFNRIHQDKTIYIIGSGKSMDFITTSFFRDKITICVNMTWLYFPSTYMICHHHTAGEMSYNFNNIQQALTSNQVVFTSEYDNCVYKNGQPRNFIGDLNIYAHRPQSYTTVDFTGIYSDNPNMILTGGTTIIDAIGLALYMGAVNIVLCGCDAGSINDESNFEGYYPLDFNHKSDQHGHSVTSYELIKLIRDEIKEICNMYTLNPWLDFQLEGNLYDPVQHNKERQMFNIKSIK